MKHIPIHQIGIMMDILWIHPQHSILIIALIGTMVIVTAAIAVVGVGVSILATTTTNPTATNNHEIGANNGMVRGCLPRWISQRRRSVENEGSAAAIPLVALLSMMMMTTASSSSIADIIIDSNSRSFHRSSRGGNHPFVNGLVNLGSSAIIIPRGADDGSGGIAVVVARLLFQHQGLDNVSTSNGGGGGFPRRRRRQP